MNKATFLKKLKSRLKGMPKDELKDALEYYNEYFLDSGISDDEDVIPMVGSPEEAARRIISECTDKTIEAQKADGSARNNVNLLWMVVLGICAAPIALPIVIVICALLFTIIAVVVSVLVALFVTALSLIIAFVALIPAIFWATTAGQAYVIAGFICIGVSLGIIFSLSFIELINLFIRFCAKLISRIFLKRRVN